ncbi:MAG: HlyD family efflux transporter periplasmic adaptor subunit [Cyanobacteriota bacterium]|nr:HlyD family efflux transporter periplasmic adaptor subunit [Cyanobacteriota bacterium]
MFGLVAALAGAALTLTALVATRQLPLSSRPPARTTAPAKPAPAPKPAEAVGALGRLQPAGEIRVLAAPIAGVGGSPRITRLLVNEGDRVERGQVLALFDTRPTLAAEKLLIDTRLANLARRLRVEERELNRYRQLTRVGALSADELDRREQQYLQLLGEWQVARADVERVRADLDNTVLRAPITGTVLRLIAHAGERPTDKGILELGANDRMEALLEVYESDIDRVRLGQGVRLSSENGGFAGSLRGTVLRISPQVRQREVLSTDPSGDVDARIVEVRVALTPEDARRVRALTGLKVIARLDP